MSISEIKELTKYLTEEEVEKIKQEIKDKESTLKGGNLDEQEMIQVLNTLFAVLVIEKALQSEMEGIEEIKDELQAELLECYEVYDTYMAKFRNQDKKKKKKRWLLSFFGLSEDISKRKNDIGASNKAINNIQRELNSLKQQKSNDNLRDVVSKRNPNSVRDFCDSIRGRIDPRDMCPQCIDDRRNDKKGPGKNHHRHHHHQDTGNINRKPNESANNNSATETKTPELSSINRRRMP